MVDAVLVEEVVDSFEDRAAGQEDAVLGGPGVDEDAGPRKGAAGDGDSRDVLGPRG